MPGRVSPGLACVSRPFRGMPVGLVCGDIGGMPNPRRRLYSLAVSATGAAVILVGCQAGGAQPSDFCKSVDSLDAAVTQINQNYLSKSTVAAVETSLATVGAAVKNLSKTVESQFADEVHAVEAAAAQLDKTVSAAVDRPVPANMSAARTSMSELTTAVNNLSQSTSQSC
jgi:hypothetical protein